MFNKELTYISISAEYAEIPLIPPYLQPGYHRFTDGANFASGGAGILDDTNPEVVCYSFLFTISLISKHYILVLVDYRAFDFLSIN